MYLHNFFYLFSYYKIGDNMNIHMNELKPEYNIIDIRDSIYYNSDHVYNAVNISMKLLLNNPSKYINKNETYYIYCSGGVRSKKTCELLRLLGYNVINIIEGFDK